MTVDTPLNTILSGIQIICFSLMYGVTTCITISRDILSDYGVLNFIVLFFSTTNGTILSLSLVVLYSTNCLLFNTNPINFRRVTGFQNEF